MCAGTREDGSVIAANDPHWDKLTEVAKSARTRPEAWLEQATIYGDLAADPVFVRAFSRWLSLIWAQGTQAAIDTYLGG